MVNKHLKVFGMASGLAVIGGFIVDESMDNMKNAFRELLQKVKPDLNFE